LFRRTTSIFRRIRQLSSRVFSPNLSSVPWENLELRMALRGAKKWSSAWFPSNARRTSQLLTKDECMSVKIYVYFVKVFYVFFVDRILDVCFRIFDSLLSVYSFVCRKKCQFHYGVIFTQNSCAHGLHTWQSDSRLSQFLGKNRPSFKRNLFVIRLYS
jgi:hypothetical protein